MSHSRSPSIAPPILLLLAIGLVTACYPKAAVPEAGFRPGIAATDDTVHNYGIAILPDHRFAYTITHGDQHPALRDYYHGTWTYRADTLFLHYHKQEPPGATPYLVKEITGGWLIQFFTDGRPRILLRVSQRLFR